MAILEVLGELTGFSTPAKAWSLKNDDTKEVIRGQFLPEGYTENQGAVIPESTTVNQATPFPQWVRGEQETANFTVRIFAAHSFKDIRRDVNALKNASQKDNKLKRAPIFTFSYGIDIAFKCFVVTVGGVRYDEIRSDGSLRGATFNITLKRIAPADLQTRSKASDLARKIKFAGGVVAGVAGLADTLGLINLPGGSLHTKGKTIKAKDGDTFESIAALEYGDALVGDILRRVQPDKANLEPGDEVILIVDEEIFDIDVTPQAVALRDTPENQEVKEIKFDDRNRPTAKVI